MPHVGLLIKQADCQAVILYDPDKHVLANVHCGWRGNVADILGTTVKHMSRDFECKPVDILAGIGPSLGPCCGEFKGYEDIFPASFRPFMVSENYFDLWSLSRNQLIAAGLKKGNIQTAGVCTKCRTDLFFSYRAEGATGRFGTVAMLK
jgi:YfiH family protein